MAWLQAHIQVTNHQVPLIEQLFETLGALSISLGDGADQPMFEPAPGETPIWPDTLVSALFPGDTDADQLIYRIEQNLVSDLSRQLQLEILEDRDWERVWLERFKPMQFGQRLWICPTVYKQVPDEDAIVVVLDPGLAFGTGTHPTTGLCLQWLDEKNLNGSSLVDYGCGSGVLGIAGLKLGASQVTAIDHDPQALTATRNNAEQNGVSGKLITVHSDAANDYDLPDGRGADYLIANILANTLVDLATQILRFVRPGGQIALSGILPEQVDEVTQAYQDHVDFYSPRIQEEWCLLTGIIRPS